MVVEVPLLTAAAVEATQEASAAAMGTLPDPAAAPGGRPSPAMSTFSFTAYEQQFLRLDETRSRSTLAVKH